MHKDTQSQALQLLQRTVSTVVWVEICVSKLANISYCRRRSQGSTDLPQTLKTS